MGGAGIPCLSLISCLKGMLNEDQQEALHRDNPSGSDGSSSDSAAVVEAAPNIVHDDERKHFLEDWGKQTITLVLSDRMALQGRNPRQQTHAICAWRNSMSEASMDQFIESILLQLPSGRHAELFAYEVAWKTVKDGVLRRMTNKPSGPWAQHRILLCDWFEVNSAIYFGSDSEEVTPLSLASSQTMAYGAANLLQDTGTRVSIHPGLALPAAWL